MAELRQCDVCERVEADHDDWLVILSVNGLGPFDFCSWECVEKRAKQYQAAGVAVSNGGEQQ
jgi:hypothetical protein